LGPKNTWLAKIGWVQRILGFSLE